MKEKSYDILIRKENDMGRLMIILLCLVVLGCGDGSGPLGLGKVNCDKKINEAYTTYGNPDNISKYDNGDYHSWTFTYGKHRLILTFTWSRDYDCDASSYTY
jgi:hypothetical protein